MSKSPSPESNSNSFLKFLHLVVPSLALVSTIACGGGSSQSSTRVLPPPPAGDCALPVPIRTSPKAQGGVGKSVPTTFMDLHIGSSELAWPTVAFGGLRLWDTATGWAQINTADGVYDWSTLDKFTAAAQAHSVDLLYNLARTPTWASSGPTVTTCAYADIAGGPGQCQPPVDLNSDGTGPHKHWI